MTGERRSRWLGAEYAETSAHHRAVDEWFLTRIRPEAEDTVVDLGCGSGEFTAVLAESVPRGRVIGVDEDPSMLAAADRYSAPNLEFVRASATDFDRHLEPGVADLVVSRSMLHWLAVADYPAVFGAVYRTLRPGGWFHSESAGAGNMAGLMALLGRIAAANGLRPPAPFPDAGTVFDMLRTTGFDIPADGVRTVAQLRPFTRAQLADMLRTTASVSLTRQAEAADAHRLVDELVAGTDELLRSDGTYDQTFVRLEILVRRPSD
ncbi:Trans-aconitate methyltransferase [Nocardia amikacinitolerans]|uniref:class I SAM-dependent methyltransferase n=1 Tax=Nocardia amikacinitolerans TaxID=756689 RepID=UPI0020A38B51|nr:class I SAM-dependent methyltransferase [Nocardia amikacinitolerans]MCP2298158.1 Trans-aconitate methyltransferase [Nocardia amikacinitolerans]